MTREFCVFRGCDSSYGEAKTVLLGIPLDSPDCFRPGASLGPAAIRSGSCGLETFSPIQGAELSGVYDTGELPLDGPSGAPERIEKAAAEYIRDGKLPFLLGGGAAVTPAAVRALYRSYPRLHLIQFAAHAGLRRAQPGEAPGRASGMRRCYELLGEQKIHQFCIRSGSREEFEFALKHTDMHPFNFGWLEPTLSPLIRDRVPLYLALELDCLDPSVLPGTDAPEPEGVDFSALQEAVLKVCKGNVVGVAVTELVPSLDPTGASTAAASRLVRELLIALSKKR